MAVKEGVIMMNCVREMTLEEKIRASVSPEVAEDLIYEVKKEIDRVREIAYGEVRAVRREMEQKDNIIKGLAGYIGFIKD